jgi:trehalose 6-phosphate phosphatase
VLDVAATIDALVERPSETVLLSDFDGSLSPIVDRPDEAVGLHAGLDAIAALVGRLGRVGIVSGRPVEFLAAQFRRGLVLAGLYGMESMMRASALSTTQVVPFLGAVARHGRSQRGCQGHRRAQGVGVTFHWRRARSRQEVLGVAAGGAPVRPQRAAHRCD